MSVELATLLLFGMMLLLLFLGLPIAFALGASAVIFGVITNGWDSLYMLITSAMGTMRTIVLIAVPLYIFMGNVLETSGLAEAAYATAYKWLGGLRGGLALATVAVCTLFAACTGISGASTVAMGLVALPAMLKRGYEKKLAVGCVMAGGALGVLIPPSLTMILFGFMAEESIGRLFAGGVLPGMVLSGIFMVYVIFSCAVNPSLGPALPKPERASWGEKLVSLRVLILPVLLIAGVLGVIFSGLATPTEAAAVGSLGAIICAAITRKLNYKNLKKAAYATITLGAMVIWIVVGATAFTTVFTAAGGSDLVKNIFLGLEISPILIIAMMQITFFILGCFMDPTGIIMLTTPIFVPVIRELGYSVVWFGILFVVNMEMAYLTPPYGFNLFYMRGLAPREITMMDIYKSAVPFVVLQGLTLALVMIFPGLATGLPNLMFGPER